MLAVLNRKGAIFTPRVNFAFCGFSGGGVIETGVFAVLVHLSDILITFCFCGLRSHLLPVIFSHHEGYTFVFKLIVCSFLFVSNCSICCYIQFFQ